MSPRLTDFPFGYCTNVHAGISLQDCQSNLEKISTQVRSLTCPQASLPIGLWLAEQAARELVANNGVSRLYDWLGERGLSAYTFNGFPQGDFHQPVVKHRVYEPTWLESSRAEYTWMLAEILSGLLPPGAVGSISTLPLGWPHQAWSADEFHRSARQLQQLANQLHALFERTGREIILALEPEPGCVLDTAPDVIQFFEGYLFSGPDSDIFRRHLTVCHDICHSAVMFEPQQQALEAYAHHGIRVGKVQVSSAVEVPWQDYAGTSQAAQALSELKTFNEPRYLHQTTRVNRRGQNEIELVDDLSQALAEWLPAAGTGPSSSTSQSWPDQAWRIHFHVPIFVEQFGWLKATRAEIAAAVACFQQQAQVRIADRPWFTGHYEVETYAWGVLPASLQSPSLAEGISRELKFFQQLLSSPDLSPNHCP